MKLSDELINLLKTIILSGILFPLCTLFFNKFFNKKDNLNPIIILIILTLLPIILSGLNVNLVLSVSVSLIIGLIFVFKYIFKRKYITTYKIKDNFFRYFSDTIQLIKKNITKISLLFVFIFCLMYIIIFVFQACNNGNYMIFNKIYFCKNLFSTQRSEENTTTIKSNLFSGKHYYFSVTLPNNTKSISEGAFKDTIFEKKLIIPKSVEIIEEEAFFNCTFKEGIEFENDSKLKTIKSYAFTKTNIKNIVLPPSLTETGAGIFMGCKNLEAVTLSENMHSIEQSFFSECKNLKYIGCKNEEKNEEKNDVCIKIPYNITYIGSYAFSGCFRDENNENEYFINLNLNNVQTISDRCFNGCNKIKEIKSQNITAIPEGAFSSCDALETFDFSGIEYIEQNAFWGCKKLEKIDFGASLKYIKKFAFYNTGIKTITIPKNVFEIHNSAFMNCSNFKSYEVDENNPCFLSLNGILCNKQKNKIYSCPSNWVLKDEVTNEAFSFSKNGKFKISGNIVYISPGAFSFHKNKNAIKFIAVNTNNKNYVSYYNSVFSKDYKTLYIPNPIPKTYSLYSDKVENIAPYAFAGSNVTNVSLKSTNIKNISEHAFYECKNLEIISLPTNIEKSDQKKSIGQEAFGCCEKLEDIVIPAGYTDIEDYAFSKCKNLEKVYIPTSVINIGEGAFEFTNIKEMRFSESTENIGDNIFNNCEQLNSITFPKNFENFKIQSLYGCINLKNIYVPKNYNVKYLELELKRIKYYNLKNYSKKIKIKTY